MPKACQNCGNQDRLAACRACGKAQYCSVDCQKTDWKFHKEHCKIELVPSREPSNVIPMEPEHIPARREKIDIPPMPRKPVNVSFAKEAAKACIAQEKQLHIKLLQDLNATLIKSKFPPNKQQKIAKFIQEKTPLIAKLVANSSPGTLEGMSEVERLIFDFMRLVGFSNEELEDLPSHEKLAEKIFMDGVEKADKAVLNASKLQTTITEPFETPSSEDRVELVRVARRNQARTIGNACYPNYPNDGEIHYRRKEGKIVEVDTQSLNSQQEEARNALIESAFVDYQTAKTKFVSEWEKALKTSSFIEGDPPTRGRSAVRSKSNLPQNPRTVTSSGIDLSAFYKKLLESDGIEPEDFSEILEKLSKKELAAVELWMIDKRKELNNKAGTERDSGERAFLSVVADRLSEVKTWKVQRESEVSAQLAQTPKGIDKEVRRRDPHGMIEHIDNATNDVASTWMLPIIISLIIGFIFYQTVAYFQIDNFPSEAARNNDINWHLSRTAQIRDDLLTGRITQLEADQHLYSHLIAHADLTLQEHKETALVTDGVRMLIELNNAGGQLVEGVMILSGKEMLPLYFDEPMLEGALLHLVSDYLVKHSMTMLKAGWSPREIAEFFETRGVYLIDKEKSETIRQTGKILRDIQRQTETNQMIGTAANEPEFTITDLQAAIAKYRLPKEASKELGFFILERLTSKEEILKKEDEHLRTRLLEKFNTLYNTFTEKETRRGHTIKNGLRMDKVIEFVKAKVSSVVQPTSKNLLLAWIKYKEPDFWTKYQTRSPAYFSRLTYHIRRLFSSPLFHDLLEIRPSSLEMRAMDTVNKISEWVRNNPDISDPSFDSVMGQYIDELSTHIEEYKSGMSSDIQSILLEATEAETGNLLLVGWNGIINFWNKARFLESETTGWNALFESYLLAKGLYFVHGIAKPRAENIRTTVTARMFSGFTAIFTMLEVGLAARAAWTFKDFLFSTSWKTDFGIFGLGLTGLGTGGVTLAGIDLLRYSQILQLARSQTVVQNQERHNYSWAVLNGGLMLSLIGLAFLSGSAENGHWPEVTKTLAISDLKSLSNSFTSNVTRNYENIQAVLNKHNYSQFDRFFAEERLLYETEVAAEMFGSAQKAFQQKTFSQTEEQLRLALRDAPVTLSHTMLSNAEVEQKVLEAKAAVERGEFPIPKFPKLPRGLLPSNEPKQLTDSTQE